MVKIMQHFFKISLEKERENNNIRSAQEFLVWWR